MSEPEVDPPWCAGAIGRIPEDDALVWRDDAMTGSQFYASSPKEAEAAAGILNALEAERRELLELVCLLCSSMIPHPVEHPTMFGAKKAALAVLARMGKP